MSDTMQKGQKLDSDTDSDALDPTTLLRYSLVSCAILCSDVGSINDIMFESVSIGRVILRARNLQITTYQRVVRSKLSC